MTTNTIDLLKSVANITSKQNKPAIKTALLDELENLLTFDVITLLKVESNSTKKDSQIELVAIRYNESSITDCLETDFSSDPQVLNCVTDKHYQVGACDKYNQLTLPLLVKNQVYGVLVIYLAKLDKTLIKTIEQLTNITANLLGTIHESEIDTLTGLLNRKTLEHNLSDFFSDLKPREPHLCPSEDVHNWLVILDIDNFKLINDKYGHTYGDEVLLLFSDIMKHNFRHSDMLFRYGGEEFIVVISFVTESQVIDILERFRLAVVSYLFPQVGRVTMSAGASRINPSLHPNTVIEQADKALYFCKENGRNQVALHHQLVVKKLIEAVDVDSDIELF